MNVIWEYRLLNFPDDYHRDPKTDRLLPSIQMFNLLGAEGWEFIYKDKDAASLFKRPKLTPDSQPQQEDQEAVAPNPTRKMVATYRNVAIELCVSYEGKEQEFWEAHCWFPKTGLIPEMAKIKAPTKERALEAAKEWVDLQLERAGIDEIY